MKIEQAGNLLLPAVGYGDAAGLPFETWSAAKIAQSVGRVERLHPPKHNPYYKGEYPIGTTSDDTQLSLITAEALLAADAFDIDVIAEKHITEYDRTPKILSSEGRLTAIGWGGSTVASMERLKTGANPLEAGALDGTGNGVIMKMAPLVLWQTARQVGDEQRYSEYDKFTGLTHATTVAKVCTRVHGDVLKALLSELGDANNLADIAIESAKTHEESLGEKQSALSAALGYLAVGDQIDVRQILSSTDGKGFYVPQTLAMAYGAYLANRPDFSSVVYGAVNLGGDTDSIGSVAATMSVFSKPEIVKFPSDADAVKSMQTLRQFSALFTQAALRNER